MKYAEVVIMCLTLTMTYELMMVTLILSILAVLSFG
jgi:hypothetical protein